MPAKRSRVVFMTKDGPKSFLAKKKRSPARSLKEFKKRVKGLPPKMRSKALAKWRGASS